MYTTEFGACLHKAELVEKEFLSGLGVDTTLLYNDIEAHVERISDIFDEGEPTTFVDAGTTYAEFEQMQCDLEDKCNALESVSATLSELKRFVQNMNKSKNKDILLDYIDRMELDID